VDATLPPAGAPGQPRAVPPRATVPESAVQRARALLEALGERSFPEA
jgi:hypothetical protein